jgi:hypothetical protein
MAQIGEALGVSAAAPAALTHRRRLVAWAGNVLPATLYAVAVCRSGHIVSWTPHQKSSDPVEELNR